MFFALLAKFVFVCTCMVCIPLLSRLPPILEAGAQYFGDALLSGPCLCMSRLCMSKRIHLGKQGTETSGAHGKQGI